MHHAVSAVELYAAVLPGYEIILLEEDADSLSGLAICGAVGVS